MKIQFTFLLTSFLNQSSVTWEGSDFSIMSWSWWMQYSNCTLALVYQHCTPQWATRLLNLLAKEIMKYLEYLIFGQEYHQRNFRKHYRQKLQETILTNYIGPQIEYLIESSKRRIFITIQFTWEGSGFSIVRRSWYVWLYNCTLVQTPYHCVLRNYTTP